ncbi:hypothetical protein M9Y10_014708 [Tritrichomonas musculus]|uniref:receptor protein-tyrosine kinase n=1 Tax=Tritrichomonas musculus TaxID=1915356 RepID=A0ABR2L094_9EUKA
MMNNDTNNDTNNRIIVAAGGSGGAATYEGCPGGDLYGRYWSDANTISPSLLTTQTLGPENSVGEAGADAGDTPGSGGGGGWRGGVSTHKGTSSYAKDAYVAVSHSGSSYISGYKECIITQNVVFEDADMEVGNKENDGQIIINSIYLCSENCFACTSAEVCVKCFDNFYLHENKCVSKCPEGFRGSGSVCEQCRENCKSCESSKDVCDVCFDSYFLYHGQCVAECPEGTRTSGTNCEDCPENCKACETSKDVCSTCKDNYFLNHGQCVTECPEGTRTSGTNCEDCLENCKACESSKDVCDSCFDTYYLHENKCVSKCPEGFRGSGSVCEQCRENCKSCESSKDVCDACVDTYYLNHGQCVTECPEGTRTSGTNCEDCPANCKACETSKDVCSTCNDNYFLNHGQCVTECPEGTRTECPEGTRTSGTNCEDCPENCKACTTSKDSCEVCFENNYLFNGKCVTECPEGTRTSGTNCEDCPENCKACETSKDVCSTCDDNYYLNHGQCVTECPEGTRTSGTNCEDCPENCKACETSKDVCSTCNDNYYLNHGQCVTECPEGTRTSGTNCEDCPENCKACTTSKDSCEVCFENNYLFNGKCVTECPEGTAVSGNVCELVPASPTPENPSETIPDIIELTENNCSSKNRCHKEIDNFHQVMVYINVTVFSSLNYTDDGGAIHLVNTGIDCKETVFNECKSKEGSGGAVYIKNSYDFKNTITLEKLTFTQCEAEYGGAIYVYANSYNNKVLIQKCTFTENIAKAQSTSSHYGGSAIYLTARKGKLYKNKFVRNIGPGGSVKLYNKFEENEQNKMKLLDNSNDQLSFIISSCSFEIEKETDCSLFYYAGSNGVPFELYDCSFSGNLKSGSHHINGQNAAKDTHKLVIKACKFSSNAKDSINMDSANNFISVDLKQQVFDGQDAKKVKTSYANWNSVTTIAVPVVAIIVILVLFVLKKSNSNSQNEMNSDNNDNSLAADETINLSLI